jgi:hypothetical protein
MTAVTARRTCGTEPLENARFCHICGSPVDERDAHAEYKQVTVLFADVVHSMDVAAVVGAERFSRIASKEPTRSAAYFIDSSTAAGRMMRTALKRATSRANGTKFGRPRKV